MKSNEARRSVLLLISTLLLVSACARDARPAAVHRTLAQETVSAPRTASTPPVAARIRALEDQPFGEVANVERLELVAWLNETSEVGVIMFPLLGTFDSLFALYGEDAGEALYFHYALGMARYILEHPNRAQNAPETSGAVDVQTAGVRAALGFYERIQFAAPQLGRHGLCEQLLALSARGGLEGYIERELASDAMGG